MKQLALLAIIVFLGSLDIYSQDYHFKPSFGVIIDSAQTKALLRQCSRSTTPKKVKTYWKPMQNDIEHLENNFNKLYGQSSKTCCIFGRTIDSLQKFGFQYAGVIMNRRKYIYINAFPLSMLDYYKERNFDLTKQPVVVCDGGPSLWGVLFDIEKLEFSSLAFNGII
jgi:hypothetical protein